MTPHEQLEQRVIALENGLHTNTQLTTEIKSDTADLVEFIRTIKGLVTFAKWTGRILTWLSPIALAVVGVWATLNGKR